MANDMACIEAACLTYVQPPFLLAFTDSEYKYTIGAKENIEHFELFSDDNLRYMQSS